MSALESKPGRLRTTLRSQIGPMLRTFLPFSLAVILAACGDGGSTSSSQPGENSPESDASPTPSPDTTPAWLRFKPGAKGYIRADGDEDLLKQQEVCPTVTDFTNMMESQENHCVQHGAGTPITIRKMHQDPGVFGGDAIYVIAANWSGLVEDDKVVAIIPKGTVLHCDEVDDGDGWSLYVGGYTNDDEVSIGRSAFKAVVRHTLEPSETLGPAVHILSGGGRGKNGYLMFKDLSDHCTIDGTALKPDFDWYASEQGE